ncbi:hypothetical protein L7F22_016208 [Adiantum nelumboides]|nr:hypothetical protein [Adiantum nelumboides]
MGLDSTCFATPSVAPMLQGEAFTDTGADTFSCLTVPSFLESSSPSSESSTTSSSTSELFNSIGLNNDASTLFERSTGGDAASAVSTSSSKYESSSPHFDCHGTSSPLLNIPSPILEEDLTFSMHEVDGMSEDLDRDLKPRSHEMCISDSCYRGETGCNEDMLLSRSDKFLEPGTNQEVVGESGLPSMDDLFPDLSLPQDFNLADNMVDEMSAWSAVDNLQGLESSTSFPTAEDMQAATSSTFGSGGEEESASQMFAHWLQSNAHWVSLSDLRRIKLKTSTIENVTNRLGGGKKGLMLFLKFVLMWVQNSRQNAVTEKGEAMASPSALHPSLTPSPGFGGTTGMTLEGASSKDTVHAAGASCNLLGGKTDMQTAFSGCGSSPTAALSFDWTTSRPQGAQSTLVHPSISSPMSNGYATIANGGACSPLPGTNFYHSNSPWFHQSNIGARGVCASAMSPSLQLLARGSNNRPCNADVSSMMMSMQQQQCPDATPAATTRAARKSRMERQRWSVRRNRKWAASSQHHRLAAATTSGGYAHSSITSWSQSFGNGMHKSYPISQSCQQSSKGSTTANQQQSRRPERNLKLLFHKELKLSDVGSLGRIVLPKKAAETCLPPLELRDGVNLVVEDMNSTKVWNMRYRFWPNNKSRMYLLENTSDFVKLYDLKEGDYMMMYLDSLSNRYVIRGVKGSGIQSAGLASRGNNDVHAGDKRSRSLSEEAAVNLVSMVAGATNADDSGEDSLLVELIEQSLEDWKDS